jgi:uncharacterized protein YjbJ (UPF0337 family)
MSSGNTDETKGRFKEAAGDLTDNDRLRREGKVDQASGGLKGFIDKIKNAINRR